MKDGVISQNTDSWNSGGYGGGVYASTFTIAGGEISGNTAMYGGSNSEFGLITEEKTTKYRKFHKVRRKTDTSPTNVNRLRILDFFNNEEFLTAKSNKSKKERKKHVLS
jgi:hypothetical protein